MSDFIPKVIISLARNCSASAIWVVGAGVGGGGEKSPDLCNIIRAKYLILSGICWVKITLYQVPCYRFQV